MNPLKQEAVQLRRQGKTYNQIVSKLHISKGTLSYWFQGEQFDKIKKKIYNQAQRRWSNNITIYNRKRGLKIQRYRQAQQENYKKEIGIISRRELLLIGTSLYWAEGYKKTRWCISFCNSDPTMVKVIMRFFRDVCKVPPEKLRAHIQTHPNISENSAKQFWSSISQIPICQFNKTQRAISKSSKLKRGNTLPYGTLHIRVFDKKLVDKIKGWIAGIEKAF